MATYTTDTTNPTALTSAETVTIDQGAVVTITNSAWSAAGSGAIIITWGTLLLENTSITAGMVFKMADQAKNITVSARGTLKVRGNWITLGTGNGNANQTVTHWSGEYCPVVWVETGSGTGVFEKYLNLTGQMVTHTMASLSAVGAGEYGRFFTQSGTTLSFGTGTNGKCPPSGATIRVPNIILTHGNASVVSPYFSGIDGAGTFDFNCCQMSKVQFRLTATSYNPCNIVSTAICAQFSTEGYIPKVYLEDCGNGFNHNAINTLAAGGYGGTILLHLHNCAFYVEGGSTSYPTVRHYSTVGELKITNSFIMQWNNTTNNTYYAIYLFSGATTIKNTTIVGRVYGNMGNTIDVDTVTCVANPKLIEDTSYKHYFYHTGTANITGKFKNVTVPAGGGSLAAILLYIATGSGVANLEVSGLNVQSSVLSSYVAINATGNTIKVFDCVGAGLQAALSGPVGLASSQFSSAIIQDIIVSSYPTGHAGGDGTTYRNITGAIAKNICRDSPFHTTYSGPTTGTLEVRFCNFSAPLYGAWITPSPRVAYNSDGKAYMINQGDSIIMEYPYDILGVTGFQNTAPTLSGVNTGNFTVEYAVDTGSGYGSWLACTGANLSAESVSATGGFRIKFRFTCATASATNYLDGFSVATNVDQTVKYPTAYTSITLSNVVVGSSYRIERADTGALIAAGVAEASTVAIDNTPFFSDTDVKIKVRKASVAPKYLPFETGGTLTATGLNVYIAQVHDKVAGAAGTVANDFTLNYATKKISHTNGTTRHHVNAFYSWLMDLFTTSDQMDDQEPILANTPTAYTLINGWTFDSDSDVGYLYGGSIAVEATDDLWADFFTIGGDTSLTVYWYQNGNLVPTAPGYTAGHLEQLIKVRASGADIANRIVTAFTRDSGYLFDLFDQQAAIAGGTNPIPLTAQPDPIDDGSGGSVTGITIIFGATTADIDEDGSAEPYDVTIDGGGNSLLDIYRYLKYVCRPENDQPVGIGTAVLGRFYRAADPTYSEIKAAPFGTYAAGIFLGARGVLITGVSDSSGLILRDADNIVRVPPSTPTLTISAPVSLVGAEIRIYDMDDNPSGSLGTELAGTESHNAAVYQYVGTSGNTLWVQIMLAGYEEFGQQLVFPSSSMTFYAALKVDYNA